MEAQLVTFAVVCAIGIATPGPEVFLTMNNGCRYGVRFASIGLAGVALSDFVLISAVSLGLGAILATSEMMYAAIQWGGVAYLAILGLVMLRARHSTDEGGQTAIVVSGRALFIRSFLVSATNVQGWLFFAAFLPQFLVPGASQGQQLMVLGTIVVLVDVIVLFGYAAFGATISGLLQRSGTVWMERACGGIEVAGFV